MPSAITNIAGYRFVDLVDLDRLQSVFRSVCLDLGLKGTVLSFLTLSLIQLPKGYDAASLLFMKFDATDV